MSEVIENERSNVLYEVIKRIIDIVASFTGLIVLSPLMLVVSILIKLESKGEVIFKQKRVGLNGKEFYMYKFRSMVINAEELKAELESQNEMSGPMFKMKDDPRITKIGKFIRKTSIDELPQLINVIKGDMSLVGPRPSLPKEVEEFETWMRERLEVKPGLTCIWQVSGRNNIDFEDWMKLDVKYVEERNFWIDIKLIFKTVFVLFGDKNAGGIVLLKSFKDYYYGYESVDGKPMPGYMEMIENLNNDFPLSEPQIIGEQNQKDFIALFGAILRMRNLLLSFDEFKGNELISERDLQDYLGRYQDLRDEWKRKRQESTDITDDVVFEIELIKQIEINIDYILMLVKKYHDTHCKDKEVLITINKAIDASPELRSKKQLIENFISGINDVDDVMDEWHSYVAKQRKQDLDTIITEERLKPEDTRKFMENAFRDGEIKTVGTDIDKLMPPISRFGGGGRTKKKQNVIDRLKAFFEKYFGIGGSSTFTEENQEKVTYDIEDMTELQMVADNTYEKKL